MARAAESASRGSTPALQRLAVAAEVGTASSRLLYELRPGSSAGALRPGWSARHSDAPAPPERSSYPAIAGVRPSTRHHHHQQQQQHAAAAHLVSGSAQLSQLLHSSMAGPLVCAVNGPQHAQLGSKKRIQHSNVPPGTAMSAPVFRLQPPPAAAGLAPVQLSSRNLSTSAGIAGSPLVPTALQAMQPSLHNSRGSAPSSQVSFSRPSASAARAHSSHPQQAAELQGLESSSPAQQGPKAPTPLMPQRSAVKPHRTTPYRPGSVLDPDQLIPPVRPGTSAGAATAATGPGRPTTANPITHSLLAASLQAGSTKQAINSVQPVAGQNQGLPWVGAASERGLQSRGALQSRGGVQGAGSSQQWRRPETAAAQSTTGMAPATPTPVAATPLLLSSAAEPLQSEGSMQPGNMDASTLESLPEATSVARQAVAPCAAPGVLPVLPQLGDGEHVLHPGTTSLQLPAPTPVVVTTITVAPAAAKPGAQGAASAATADQHGNAMQAAELGTDEARIPPLRPSTSASRPATGVSEYSTQALALGRGGALTGPRRGLASVMEDDVDSIDLTLQRLRRDNNQHDDNASINLLDDAQSVSDLGALLLDAGRNKGLKGQAGGGGAVLHASTKAGLQGRLAVRRNARKAMAQAAPMVLSLEDLTYSTPEVLELEMGRMSLEELLHLDSKISAERLRTPGE